MLKQTGGEQKMQFKIVHKPTYKIILQMMTTTIHRYIHMYVYLHTFQQQIAQFALLLHVASSKPFNKLVWNIHNHIEK